MDQVELACPFCAGRFQAEAASQSRATTCPNCGRTVTVPAVPRHPLPPRDLSVVAQSDDAVASRRRYIVDAPVEPRSPFDLAEPTKTIVNRRGEPVPLRRLSPDERERYRRRLNWLSR